MSDIFSQSKRSEIMSKISGRETKLEILVRKYLFANGFRYRKNVCTLPGKPDIVLPKYKVAIFVNGCFWHGHTCKRGTIPYSNREFWYDKISKNKIRDQSNIDNLILEGWKVIVVWQCELSNKKKREIRLIRLVEEISGNEAIRK